MTGVASSWSPRGIRLSWEWGGRVPPWLVWVQRGVGTRRVGSRGMTRLGSIKGGEAIGRGRRVIPTLRAIHRGVGVIVPRWVV